MRGYLTALILLFSWAPHVLATQTVTKYEAYERCLSSHFEIPGVTSNEERHYALMVTIRAMRDACGGEVQVTLARPYEPEGALVVTIVEASGVSVYEQLERLSEEHPDRPYDDLCQEVRTKHETRRFADHHRVASLLTKLERLRISLIPPGDMVLDGNRYLIQVWCGAGRALVTFDGVGSQEGRPTSEPLEAWTEEVYSELGLGCASVERGDQELEPDTAF